MDRIKDKRIGILAADGFEQSELMVPKQRLEEARRPGRDHEPQSRRPRGLLQEAHRGGQRRLARRAGGCLTRKAGDVKGSD